MSKIGSKRSFIDSVEVKSPCSESWDEMSGNERVRFCSHCAKHVNDLSQMTRKEATRLVRSSGGDLCIRYIPHPVTRRPMFAEQLLQITRRRPAIAAGVVTASVLLSTQTYAQGDASPLPMRSLIEQGAAGESLRAKTPSTSGRIKGTVVDPAGAVIPNAKVTVYCVSAGKTITTLTDDEGGYIFKDLSAGRYRVESESPGFATTSREIEVTDRAEGSVDLSMDVGGFELIVDVTLDVETTYAVAGGIGAIEYSTPLASAVDDEDIELVRELLARGEDPNGKDDNYGKITPLFVAVETGNLDIVRLLLDFGAKVNARNSDKQTPLMRLDEDATPELVEILIRQGAKLNLTDNENNTALIAGIDNGIEAAVVQALIRAGADVRLANKQGITALMNAAENDDLEMVKLLIEAGADVNAKDDEGETAWDKTSDEEIEQYLVGHCAIVEVNDESDDDAPDEPGS